MRSGRKRFVAPDMTRYLNWSPMYKFSTSLDMKEDYKQPSFAKKIKKLQEMLKVTLAD